MQDREFVSMIFIIDLLDFDRFRHWLNQVVQAQLKPWYGIW